MLGVVGVLLFDLVDLPLEKPLVERRDGASLARAPAERFARGGPACRRRRAGEEKSRFLSSLEHELGGEALGVS